jgi:hypothetical protein
MALEMCTDGNRFRPLGARAGIVDHVVDGDLRQPRLRSRANTSTDRLRRERGREPTGLPGVGAATADCERMRASLARTAKGVTAPHAAVQRHRKPAAARRIRRRVAPRA